MFAFCKQIARTKKRRRGDGRADGLVGDDQPVMRLERRAQRAQDLLSLRFGRLGDIDRAEAPLERGVLLNVAAVFLARRRAEDLQLPAAERGL